MAIATLEKLCHHIVHKIKGGLRSATRGLRRSTIHERWVHCTQRSIRKHNNSTNSMFQARFCVLEVCLVFDRLTFPEPLAPGFCSRYARCHGTPIPALQWCMYRWLNVFVNYLSTRSSGSGLQSTITTKHSPVLGEDLENLRRRYLQGLAQPVQPSCRAASRLSLNFLVPIECLQVEPVVYHQPHLTVRTNTTNELVVGLLTTTAMIGCCGRPCCC